MSQLYGFIPTRPQEMPKKADYDKDRSLQAWAEVIMNNTNVSGINAPDLEVQAEDFPCPVCDGGGVVDVGSIISCIGEVLDISTAPCYKGQVEVPCMWCHQGQQQLQVRLNPQG